MAKFFYFDEPSKIGEDWRSKPPREVANDAFGKAMKEREPFKPASRDERKPFREGYDQIDWSK